MDLFGWLCEEDYQDITNWVQEINHCNHVGVHKKCSVYQFDFYSESPMKSWEFEMEKEADVEESDTEAQTDEVGLFMNVQIKRR